MSAPQTHLKKQQATTDLERDTTTVDEVALPGIGSATGLVARPSMIRRHGDDALGGDVVTDEVAGVLRRRRGGGDPLPDDLSGAFGSHFGQDFSGVRMHADREAGQIAQSLQSTAFTHGSDIYFAPGAYRPGSDEGQRLIAHELSHVVAQRTGADRGESGPLRVGHANDPAEAAADRSAGGAMTALRRSAHPVPVEAGASSSHSPVVPELRRDLAEPPLNDVDNGRGTFVDKTVEHEEEARTQKLGMTGSSTTTKRVAKAGVWGKDEGDSVSRVGRGLVAMKHEVTHHAGASAWVETVTKCSDDELKAAMTAGFRAGAFAEGSGSVEYQNGMFSTGAEGSFDARSGAWGESSASLSVDTSGLIPAIAAALSAEVYAGVSLEVAGKAYARLGQIALEVGGKAAGFAGAFAKASGKFEYNWKSINVEGEAEVFAGAKAEAEASVTATLGPAELTLMGEAAAAAGAGAKAAGKLSISFTGVEISGEAEAWAGVKAEASASIKGGYRGREIFSAKGEVSVSAGIGGEIKGKFSFKDGKISLDFGLGGALGIGGSIGASLEIDLYALGEAIASQVYERINRYKLTITEDVGLIDRQVIVDPIMALAVRKHGYDVYLPPFRAYGAKKMGGGSNGIKGPRVQQILDDYRGAIGRDLVFMEADEGIVQAAKDAFGPLLKDIAVVGGKLTKFEAVGSGDIAEVRTTAAQQDALNVISAALTKATEGALAGSKKSSSTSVPDAAALTSAVKKGYSGVVSAFGKDTSKADAEIKKLIDSTYDKFDMNATVTAGVVTYTVDTTSVDTANKDHEAATTKAALDRAAESITAACSQYAGKKAAEGKNGIKKDVVAGIIKKNGGPLLKADDQQAADIAITNAVKAGLGAAINGFLFMDGSIRMFDPANAAQIKAKFAADAAAAKRAEQYKAVEQELFAYVSKKTRQGENGIKLDKVQSILTSAFGKIPAAFQGEADTELAKAVTTACDGFLRFITVKDGKLSCVYDEAAMTAAKDQHAADAARVGNYFGDDEGNQRRYDAARKVRPAMEELLSELRTNPRQLIPSAELINAYIKTAMIRRIDELTFADTRAEIVLTVNRVFDGVLTIEMAEDGKVTVTSTDPGKLAEMRKTNAFRTAASAAAIKWVASLGVAKPMVSSLQAAIDKATLPADGLTPKEQDDVLKDEIIKALGKDRVRDIAVIGLRIVSFDLAW